VPLDAIEAAGGVIAIETAQTFVPAERGGGADRRRLGCASSIFDKSSRFALTPPEATPYPRSHDPTDAQITSLAIVLSIGAAACAKNRPRATTAGAAARCAGHAAAATTTPATATTPNAFAPHRGADLRAEDAGPAERRAAAR
jgi:hypothetical protein